MSQSVSLSSARDPQQPHGTLGAQPTLSQRSARQAPSDTTAAMTQQAWPARRAPLTCVLGRGREQRRLLPRARQASAEGGGRPPPTACRQQLPSQDNPGQPEPSADPRGSSSSSTQHAPSRAGTAEDGPQAAGTACRQLGRALCVGDARLMEVEAPDAQRSVHAASAAARPAGRTDSPPWLTHRAHHRLLSQQVCGGHGSVCTRRRRLQIATALRSLQRGVAGTGPGHRLELRRLLLLLPTHSCCPPTAQQLLAAKRRRVAGEQTKLLLQLQLLAAKRRGVAGEQTQLLLQLRAGQGPLPPWHPCRGDATEVETACALHASAAATNAASVAHSQLRRERRRPAHHGSCHPCSNGERNVSVSWGGAFWEVGRGARVPHPSVAPAATVRSRWRRRHPLHERRAPARSCPSCCRMQRVSWPRLAAASAASQTETTDRRPPAPETDSEPAADGMAFGRFPPASSSVRFQICHLQPSHHLGCFR